MNFLLDVSLFLNTNEITGFEFKIRAPPEFQCVHKKNTIQKQPTLGLPWTLEGGKARGKPTNSLTKKKKL